MMRMENRYLCNFFRKNAFVFEICPPLTLRWLRMRCKDCGRVLYGRVRPKKVQVSGLKHNDIKTYYACTALTLAFHENESAL